MYLTRGGFTAILPCGQCSTTGSGSGSSRVVRLEEPEIIDTTRFHPAAFRVPGPWDGPVNG